MSVKFIDSDNVMNTGGHPEVTTVVSMICITKNIEISSTTLKTCLYTKQKWSLVHFLFGSHSASIIYSSLLPQQMIRGQIKLISDKPTELQKYYTCTLQSNNM